MENSEHTEHTEPAESIESDVVNAASPTPADVPPAPRTSAELVETWFTKHFHNMSALYDERAYAHLLGAKEDLKVVLAQSV